MSVNFKRLVIAAAAGLLLAACFKSGKPAPAPEAPAPVAEPAAAPPAGTPAPPPETAEATPGSAVDPSLVGDPAKGKRVFAQCASCHALAEGRHNVGPSLYQIVGRTAGTMEGFKYSDANASSGIVWTEEALFTYLEKPSAMIPGTIMTFAGLRKPQDRADLIAYLKSPD